MLIDRKVRYIAAAGALILATVLPALVSAAQITERSVELSSSVKAATGVSYKFNFTASATAGAVLVQFCDNTPLIGEFCDAPAGFSSSGATVSSGGTLGSATANKVIVTKSVTAGAVTFELAGITNPSSTGPLYARILTYVDASAAASYVVTDSASALGSPIDQGSAAISITEGVNVSGAVLETMTFCVSGAAITEDCNRATSGVMVAPTLKLGRESSGVIALDSLDVYEGTIYTQISTNAVNGAVVSLKSSAANCGGLLRAGAPSACDIAPAGTSGTIAAGQAKFGVKTGATDADADGTIRPFNTGNYDATNFRMNFVAGNASGVTGPYGDPLLDTANAPANNKNMPLTFGASVANNTPAGLYSADLSLIATGKF